MTMRNYIILIFLLISSCTPLKYKYPTYTPIPSLAPPAGSTIPSNLAYSMQTYGSPDGKWLVEITGLQVKAKTVDNTSVLSSSFLLNPGEYTIFAGWSPDSTAFIAYEASYRIGCPLKRLAIYILNDRSLSRSFYQPEIVSDAGNCMRATWSPDGKTIALVSGDNVFIVDRKSTLINKITLKSEYNKSSIEDFRWAYYGLLYLEKKHDNTLDDQHLYFTLQHRESEAVLRLVNIKSQEQQTILKNYYGLKLVGVAGNYVLVAAPSSWKSDNSLFFKVVDIVTGKTISNFNLSGQKYCDGIDSPSTATLVLAISRGSFCSYSVKAVSVNLDSENIATSSKEYGEIFGLLRWDTATSSFLVLRGSTSSGLWIDKIKP